MLYIKIFILPTSLDIFDVRQHYVRILYICTGRETDLKTITLAWLKTGIRRRNSCPFRAVSGTGCGAELYVTRGFLCVIYF